MNRIRLYALLGVAAFIALIYAYTREFTRFSNTIGIKPLVIGSLLAGLSIGIALIYRWRSRFSPWSKHFPEILFILMAFTVFAPLFGSWINRFAGKKQLEEFNFISEKPYLAGYGILKGEEVQPTGWVLTVNHRGTVRQFKYKTQAYYPISQPGDLISLPITHGFFGIKVVDLE